MENTFFCVVGDRSGNREVWPGGGWPTAERVGHDCERARGREREGGGDFGRRRANAGEATSGSGRR
jgi:hypothetical protein